MNAIINDYNKFHKILIDKINEPILVLNQELVCVDVNICFLKAFKTELTQIVNEDCNSIFKDFYVDRTIYETTLECISDIPINIIINQEIIELGGNKYYLLTVNSFDDRFMRNMNYKELDHYLIMIYLVLL